MLLKINSPPNLHLQMWGTCVVACPNGYLGKQQLTLEGSEQKPFHLLARSIAALSIVPLLLIRPCADHSSCQFMGGTKEHWLQDFAAHYIHRESLLEGQKYEVLAQDCMHVILTFYVLTCAMPYLIPAPNPSAAGLVISSNRWYGRAGMCAAAAARSTTRTQRSSSWRESSSCCSPLRPLRCVRQPS